MPIGNRRNARNLERFNLHAHHAHVLGHQVPELRSKERDWEVYCRKLLVLNRFYSFIALPSQLFFFVAQSRTFAGRDTPAIDDAHGRTVALVWFQQQGLAVDGSIEVVRVER